MTEKPDPAPAALAENGYQATPHAELIAQIMDSRVPKNEREHAAAREIERLTEALKVENDKTGISDEDMERFRQLGIWMAGYGYDWEQIFRAIRAALQPQGPSADDAAVLLAFQAAAIDAYTQHDGPSELDTKREQLRAAVLARMAGQGWRDIASAPKDGFFLAYTPNFGGHCAVWKADLYWLTADRGTPEHLSSKGFTHWQPLPAAPTEVK